VKDPVLIYLEGGPQRTGPGPDDLVQVMREKPEWLEIVVSHLNGRDPRVRGGAALVLARLSDENAVPLVPFVPALAAALDHEELPTRSGVMRAIARIADAAPAALEEDFDLIRLGLFDPVNAEIRAQAARAVAFYGARNRESGRRAFPHLAESLRRFHDKEQPVDLVEALLLLARKSDDPTLRADIWRAVRRHENHRDRAVQEAVRAIGSLARESEANGPAS
jgi:hypothetical protein